MEQFRHRHNQFKFLSLLNV